MKKLIALVLALCAFLSTAAAVEDVYFTVPANSKGFNTLDPDKKTPNRVYTKAGDPLKMSKAIDSEGFVVKEAGADASLQEYLQSFAVESVFMVLPNGERVRVADEAVKDLLDKIMARTVRIVKKGKTEGVSLNVEPYSAKKHSPTYEIYFVGIADKHLTEYVRKDGVYTFCTKGKGSKKGGSSSGSEPEVTEAPPTVRPDPTNTPDPKHDPVVLPPFQTPGTTQPANTPNPQHDEVVLPEFESEKSQEKNTTSPASDNVPDPKHDEVVLPAFGSAAPAPQAQQSEATAASTTVTTTSSEAVVAVPQVEVEPEKPVVAEQAQEETKSSGSDSGNPDPSHDKVTLPWG